MKKTLIFPLIFVGLWGVGCGGDDGARRGNQTAAYETVQEGSAAGVTSTIQGPGEALPPITGTNADTTTAFSIDPNVASAAPAPNVAAYPSAYPPPMTSASQPRPAYVPPPQQRQQAQPTYYPAPPQQQQQPQQQPQPRRPVEQERPQEQPPATDTTVTTTAPPPQQPPVTNTPPPQQQQPQPAPPTNTNPPVEEEEEEEPEEEPPPPPTTTDTRGN